MMRSQQQGGSFSSDALGYSHTRQTKRQMSAVPKPSLTVSRWLLTMLSVKRTTSRRT